MSNVDKASPGVPIMLDKERHLILTLGGMIAFKKETGKDLLDRKVAVAMSKNLGLEDMVTLVWACLLHEDRNITVEDVGYMVHLGNITRVQKAIDKVYELALAEDKKDKKAPLARKSRSG